MPETQCDKCDLPIANTFPLELSQSPSVHHSLALFSTLLVRKTISKKYITIPYTSFLYGPFSILKNSGEWNILLFCHRK